MNKIKLLPIAIKDNWSDQYVESFVEQDIYIEICLKIHNVNALIYNHLFVEVYGKN